MNKTLLIIKREYLTRVRKKTFIISTILFPVLYLGLIFGMTYMGAKSRPKLDVAVIDSSGYFDRGRIERENQKDSSSLLSLLNIEEDSLKKSFSEMGYDAYIVIPRQDDWQSGLKGLSMYTSRTMGADASGRVEQKLNNIWNELKNERLGIDEDKKNIIKNSYVSIRAVNVHDATANSKVASTIGYVAGLLIYFILLIYGSQVMMGVMEEKTNRIAEVIVSSVKPFQLMLGKIIGIGLVALTQFFLWIAFIFIIYNATKASGNNIAAMGGVMEGVQNAFGSINIPMILFGFVFYFMGGFFFYSSLYAAIGSAVNEDMREAQSLSFPVTLLVIFSIAMMSVAMNDPTGPVAVWGSIIPFSSPIIMMARIPFGVPGTVPYWQLGLSMALLIAGFIFAVWLSGKIYRTGILMYGKKPTWKEMFKWAFRKS